MRCASELTWVLHFRLIAADRILRMKTRLLRREWSGDTEKVRAPLKMTFSLQRALFALTFIQLTEIAYLSHFSWPHRS